jgi:hypothetical protein
MNAPDCCLTIIAPKAMEEELCDFLLEHPERMASVVLSPALGIGCNSVFVNARELVRGRSEQIRIEVLTASQDASVLLEAMSTLFQNSGVYSWQSPIQNFANQS